MKTAAVYLKNSFAGTLVEDEDGFTFQYDYQYLKQPNAKPVSLT